MVAILPLLVLILAFATQLHAAFPVDLPVAVVCVYLCKKIKLQKLRSVSHVFVVGAAIEKVAPLPLVVLPCSWTVAPVSQWQLLSLWPSRHACVVWVKSKK